MSQTTKIEYCDSTLNLAVGCDGCELWNPKTGVRHCWAAALVDRWKGLPGWPAAFDEPELFPERMETALKWPDLTGKERPDKPWLNGMPRMIFLCDMADPFTPSLPFDWLAEHLRKMADSPHIYLLFSKQTRRMRGFFEEHTCPDNVWPTASVTSTGQSQRIVDLLAIDARMHVLSLEPILSGIDLMRLRVDVPGIAHPPDDGYRETAFGKTLAPNIDWVITGGESGPGARPSHPDWFRRIRDDCQAAGVPFFFKQHGAWLHHSQEAHLPGLYTDELSLEAGDYHQHLGDLGRLRSPKKGSGPHLAGELYHKSIESFIWPDGTKSFRVGKTAAGRLLDGRTWDEMPE